MGGERVFYGRVFLEVIEENYFCVCIFLKNILYREKIKICV